MDDACRVRLTATMTSFLSLDEVAKAIAGLGNHPFARAYIERRGAGYRWSIAHRGGPYPLLREVARLLDVPHSSLIMRFRTVDGWTIVWPDGNEGEAVVVGHHRAEHRGLPYHRAHRERDRT